MGRKKKLPIGIENFEELQKENFYLVDKTAFIQELLESWSKVTLITRPRRFGKSLTMSMLKAFFEMHGDKTVFDGLDITKEKQLCEEYMGAFPVISITLKSVEGRTYEEAASAMKAVIGWEARRFSFLKDSDKLSDEEKGDYRALIQSENGVFGMSEEVLKTSLLVLSSFLQKHYGKPVILLIDEYDVPLDKANQYGYYEQMAELLRALLHNALKTNPYLKFSILTGCLRIAKESIFTGMNNFLAISVTHAAFQQYFGFTDQEVKKLLEYYDLSDAYMTIKEWYDGYHFGNTEIYCPWDVLNYCYELLALRRNQPQEHLKPKNYWMNTSGNFIIRKLISRAKGQTRQELEQLIAGEILEKKIDENITYKDLEQSLESVWSVLLATGYLTCLGLTENGLCKLCIPNMEIRSIFVEQILNWFQ